VLKIATVLMAKKADLALKTGLKTNGNFFPKAAVLKTF